MRRRYVLARRWLRRRGPRLHRRRRCELHGRRVWLTTRATRSKRGAVFCSRECKADRAHPSPQVRARIVELRTPKCPRPDKRRFVTESECREAFRTLLAADSQLGVYQCRCRMWHAGHGPDPTLTIGARVNPDTLMAMGLRSVAGP